MSNTKNPTFFQKGYSSSPAGQKLKKSLGWANAGLLAFNLLNNALGATNATGNTLTAIGGVIGSIPTPYTAAAGTALGVIGSVVNGFTDNVNEDYKNAINSKISNLSLLTSDAKDFSGLQLAYKNLNNTYIDLGDISNWGNKGMFVSERNSARTRERNKAVNALGVAKEAALGNLSAAGRSINLLNFANLYASLFPFGGPIETIDYSTPIGYEELTRKYIRDNVTNQDKGITNMFAGIPNNILAFGGNTESNGATWSDGITHINEGGSHEENPYGGVQMGVDSQGIPNLTEENELVYNDYVFSDRLTVPKLNISKKKDHKPTLELKVLKKYEGMTYAEAAKKAEKESGADERPNDAISKRGLETTLEILARSQELQREIEKLKEMQEKINQMTPEEFALMQLQLDQQDAIAQQEAAVQLVPELQLISPEEAALMLQLAQPMMAYGGEIKTNLYALGGPLDKVAKHFDINEEDWNALSEEDKNKYIRRYKYSRNRKEKAEFLKELNKYYSSKEATEEAVKYQEEVRNSDLTLKDVDNLTEALKIKLAKWLNINIPNPDTTSNEELKEFNDNLSLTIVDAAKNQNKTVGEINNTLTSNLHDSWKPVDINSNVGYSLKSAEELEGARLDAIAKANNLKDLYKQVLENPEDVDKKAAYDAAKSEAEALYGEGFDKLYEDTEDYAHLGDNEAFRGYLNYDRKTEGSKPRYLTLLDNENTRNNNLYTNRSLYKVAGESEDRYYVPDNINDINTFYTDAPTTENNITTHILTPNIPVYIKRADSLPDNIKSAGDGTYSYVNPKDYKNASDIPNMPTWPYVTAGAMLAGLLMHNIFSPKDYTNADTIEAAARRAGTYQPVSFSLNAEYLKPHKFDRLFYANQLGAQAGATRRAIINNAAGNRGTAIAGLLAADNNFNNLLGNLYILGDKYQFDADKAVAEHNNRINLAIALGNLEAARANQLAGITARSHELAGIQLSAAIKEDINNRRALAISAGLTGLANLGLNYALNQYNNDLYKYYIDHIGANGGKLRKRRKGLI